MIWFMSHSFVLITKQPESQTVPECCALRVSALATTSLARFCPMRKAPSIKIYVGLAKQFLTNLEQAWVGAVGSLYLVENWMTLRMHVHLAKQYALHSAGYLRRPTPLRALLCSHWPFTSWGAETRLLNTFNRRISICRIFA